jgi:hypothetical protein
MEFEKEPESVDGVLDMEIILDVCNLQRKIELQSSATNIGIHTFKGVSLDG